MGGRGGGERINRNIVLQLQASKEKKKKLKKVEGYKIKSNITVILFTLFFRKVSKLET